MRASRPDPTTPSYGHIFFDHAVRTPSPVDWAGPAVEATALADAAHVHLELDAVATARRCADEALEVLVGARPRGAQIGTHDLEKAKAVARHRRAVVALTDLDRSDAGPHEGASIVLQLSSV